MVESVFVATQPAKSDPRARASKPRRRGFLTAFMKEG